ncbi:tryptophan--tRNA ligase [Artemisia annua]|uniref:tryptophan--tRNA ligase n=1 Tax=Artemisia annua TaxID=35608 RepID=A0A2U1NTS6_ARTAN|nr:tryptophan--tRNA ligase [Artemisia annua]
MAENLSKLATTITINNEKLAATQSKLNFAIKNLATHNERILALVSNTCFAESTSYTMKPEIISKDVVTQNTTTINVSTMIIKTDIEALDATTRIPNFIEMIYDGAALKDGLTTKKLVCLFSSANSGHAQASVCNIVATVHPEAASALRQECMALVTRCTGLTDNKEKQVQVREVPQERREKPAKYATKDSGKSKRTSGKKSSDAKSSFYEDYIVSVGIAWQLKDLLTHSNMSYGTSTKLQRRLPMIDKNYLPVVGSVNSHRCYCSVSTPEPAVSETSSTSVKKRIVSGVQPTGSIHLGNYLGAIKNWVSLQTRDNLPDQNNPPSTENHEKWSYGTSTKLQRRLPMIDKNYLPVVGSVNSHRCYCSVSTPEPAVSETSSTSVKKRIVSGVQPTGSIHLGNYLGAIKNWVSLQLQRRLPMIDKNYLPVVGSVNSHRCYCSVSTPEPAVSETSSTSVKKRIVSGVQPTGSIHLGNYLGAIKNWVSLQITLPYDVQQLSKATRDTAALYLACGIDTSKAYVFVQSHVRAHVELMWLLSSATPIGWLNKMIQFKEKSRKAVRLYFNFGSFVFVQRVTKIVGVALLTYPVLMASDILLYQSDLVPVGEDQKQHLELTRELAERINYLYGGRKWKKLGGRGGSIFKVPEPLIPPAGARVMSLTDGLSKMSKSTPSDQSRINLLDSKDAIANKIKRCKTDSFPGLEFDNADRPECNNLLSIYQIITNKTKEEVAQEVQDMSWGTFKPIRYEEIISDTGYLDQVLAEVASKASDIADKTVSNVYQAMGFLRR